MISEMEPSPNVCSEMCPYCKKVNVVFAVKRNLIIWPVESTV